MLHRPADSRLLSNLLSHERDYVHSLHSQLDYGQASLASFSAYASASPPPISQAIVAVAGALIGANDALRGYVLAVEEWCEQLKMLKDMEDEVGNIARDREILVDRLIKASKSNNTKRRSIIPSSSNNSTSSSIFSSSTPTLDHLTFSNSKLNLAQSELQACEAHLTEKERVLVHMRENALTGGLRARCRALVSCGWKWAEVGKLGLKALDGPDLVDGLPGSQFHKPLPNLHAPYARPSSDLSSSLTPSQSASQIFTAEAFSEHAHLSSTSSGVPTLYSALPEADINDNTSSFALNLPPAHAISEEDHLVPLQMKFPSTAEDDLGGSSDGEETDERMYEVHENKHFSKPSSAVVNVGSRKTSSSSRLSLKRTKRRTASNGHGVDLSSSISTPTPVNYESPSRTQTRNIDAYGTVTSSSTCSDGQQDSPRRRKRATFLGFGAITGLFHKRGRASSVSLDANTNASFTARPPSSDTQGQWHTRTDWNLKNAGRTDGSSDEDVKKPLAETSSKTIIDYDVLKKKSVIESKALPNPQSGQPAIQTGSTDGLAPARARAASQKKLKKATHGSLKKPSIVAGVSQNGSAPNLGRMAVGQKLASEEFGKPQTSNESTSVSSSTPVSRSPTNPQSTLPNGVSKRSASLEIPSSTTARRRAETWLDPGRATSGKTTHISSNHSVPAPSRGQASLMSIVEGVAQQNREGWLQSNPKNQLVEVHAPKSVFLSPTADKSLSVSSSSLAIVPVSDSYGKTGRGGKKRGVPSMLVQSADLHRLSTISASSSEPSLPLKDGSESRITSCASAAPKTPLRSALRNRTPSPNPLTIWTPRPGSPALSTAAISAGSTTVAIPAPHVFHPSSKSRKDDDAASTVSSAYETGHEDLEDALDAPPTPPPHEVDLELMKSIRTSHGGFVSGMKADGTEISASSSGGTATPSSRRKSVRVSLQPTFSPTPPALYDYEEEHTPWASSTPKDGMRNSTWTSRIREPNSRWEDSSEEDEEYSRAKQMLHKASKNLEKTTQQIDRR